MWQKNVDSNGQQKIRLGVGDNIFGPDGMAWTAQVSLVAPSDNPAAVNSIKLGFIQHWTNTSWNVSYINRANNNLLGLDTRLYTPMYGGDVLAGKHIPRLQSECTAMAGQT